MFVGAATLAALAFVPFVLANDELDPLLQALNSSGLDAFADAMASLECTRSGRQVLAQLSQGNKTIFAPTDDALSDLGLDLATINDTSVNDTSVADLISYHIISSNFVNQTQTYPNVTIGRTLLNDSKLVHLEGNQSQVLVWSKTDNGSYFVMNDGLNISVVNTTSYENTAIWAIDSVLVPPPNVSAVLNESSYNLTVLASFLQAASRLTNSSIVETLDSARGITLFAPNNEALEAEADSLSGLAKNATALQNVLYNHVINGSSVYSTELLTGSNYTSAAGQPCAFSYNSSGYYVSVGGSNEVEIVETNVLTSNGVIHIIDGVMVDTNSDPAAASSAFASATSVAAQSTTQAGPITATSTPTSTQGGGVIEGRSNNWKLAALVGMVAGLGQTVM